MNKNQFWQIIEQNKNSQVPAKHLMEELSKLTPKEIYSFKKNFEEIYFFAERFDLFRAAFLKIGYCDRDMFGTFRAGLISKGKDIFEKMVKDPDSLVEIEINVDDMFSLIPGNVYKNITGKSMSKGCYNVSGNYIFDDGTTLPPSDSWDFWNELETRQYLPNLSEEYFKNRTINIHTHGFIVFNRATYSKDLSSRIFEVCKVSNK